MVKNKRRHRDRDSSVWDGCDGNPLLKEQQLFLNSLSPQLRSHFFSSTHVTPDQRAEVWDKQADLGETLVNSYSWATPDSRLLKIFQHFSPIVEVGCGANAYWSKWMNSRGSVDVVALDISLEDGGKFSSDTSKVIAKSQSQSTHVKMGNLEIRPGGPETLSNDAELRMSGRTLFLCYPDEEDNDYKQVINDEEEEDSASRPISMAAACLEHFTGSTIIHVGELFGDTLSCDQAPFGRSSSSEFSQRLATEYHCILKVALRSNWLHVRDTLSVWKRSETCCMKFQDEDKEKDDDKNNDSDDDSDDELYYKYIPPDEVLPIDCAAPCVAHLLQDGNNGELKGEVQDRRTFPNVNGGIKERDAKQVHSKKQRKKAKSSSEPASIAGNAW